MKLGILGTGMIVQDFLTAVDKLKIDYIAILSTERSRGRTEELAEKYHIDKIYFDYDEMLADIQFMLRCRITCTINLQKKHSLQIKILLSKNLASQILLNLTT